MKRDRGGTDNLVHAPPPDAIATIADAHDHRRRGRPAFDPWPRIHTAKTDCRHARSVWEGIDTTPPHVKLQRPGTERRPSARVRQVEGSSTNGGQPSARTGSGRTGAQTHPEDTFTSARGATHKSTERTHAPPPRPEIRTPLVVEEWRVALGAAGISSKYPRIPEFIKHGADAGIPTLHHTFAPPNHPSIALHKLAFAEIVDIEFRKGRYWGPYSKEELESIIGPFQTSPLSLIPKLGRPGKFRLIQNLSYPRNIADIISINASIESDLYPCTWGTFSTVATLVQSLPPKSLAACRDVSEAYRIIPLAQDQWPGVVVRLSEDSSPDAKPFVVNTCTAFGKKSSGGLFGMFGDALQDIFHAAGIGPSLRWVDDFIFFLVRHEFLTEYNEIRRKWKGKIEENGGQFQKGGRLWFRGELLPNDQVEEFAEDMSTPLQDLSTTEDADYAYSMADVDNISARLGVPWERSKDVPFSGVAPFIGFDWNLDEKTVSLQEKKKEKYLQAVVEWRRQETHTLDDVQRLYGKLLHTCLIVPEGRAYLTKMEKMMGVFHETPHKPRRPPRHTDNDLLWWLRTLSKPILTREVPGPQEVINIHAYSDASSTVGIGIVIRDRWRAWALKPGWNNSGRDITWAEAVGMELLIRTVLRDAPAGARIKIFGDNRGVVEGWWTGRSRNEHVNEVFKRIHLILSTHKCLVYTRYVPSKSNPADGPSRGIFPDSGKLLPPINLPQELKPFVLPLDHNEHGIRRQLSHGQVLHPAKPKLDYAEAEYRRRTTFDLDSQAWELFETKDVWEHL